MKRRLTLFAILPFIAHAQNPGGITGSTLWLRADYNSTSSTTDGSSIWFWIDQSATATFAWQPFGTQPTYQDDATYDVNFNPVVYFTGGASLGMFSTTGLPNGKNARTIIAVASPATVTGNQYVMSWGKNTGTSGYSLGATGTQGTLSYYSSSLNTANGFWQTGQPQMLTSTWAGNGGNMNLYGVGNLVTGPTAENFNTNLGSGTVGASAWGTNSWNGSIAEVIVYPSVLSPANLEQVGSYLALKYGFTLGGSAPQNYLSSTGTTVWNAATLATWSNNIAGLALDNNSGLNQLQSRSSNTGFQTTIALTNIAATNSANTGTISNDRSFMIWGDDAKATSYTRTIISGGVTYYAMPRTWTMQKTNWTDQNIAITQDSGSKSTVLLVATDAAFTNVTQHISLTGGATTLSSAKIPSGSFFTFASIIPLPVDLVSFTGTATKTGNVLNWSTTWETNNAYFAVERSTDGRDFGEIGEVQGHGTTSQLQEYAFTDPTPVPATTNYYRLRQVDNNGWTTYSPVVSLRSDGGPLSYKVYPNPAVSTLHVALPTRLDRLGIFIYSVGGKLLQSKTVAGPGEGVDVDVSRLPAGLYYLSLDPGGTLSFIKE
ncbi:T9SS type A sorting domain-containing protein [Dinghuibacter silviterrae]|uniref:Putative secreted protein (Por secretion system target) n=1 Tax=Dinghuibacter silviterrae TaxID=1539049 RepID=A0A4R8DJ66_9BACT|nr:T9SS type A sorting domain-containing protein [Dinghuibacter silviterrae]TDW97607.1 putative secreted protein (Por secretion system target) [Dinghuibacter silviterrae]